MAHVYIEVLLIPKIHKIDGNFDTDALLKPI